MGLLDGLLGHASEIDASKLQSEFAQVLASGERVEKAYQVIRDTFVFTAKRLIFVNRQGLTGKKVEYQSIPYRSIVRFSIETAGTFDLEAELKIWLTGTPVPISLDRCTPFQASLSACAPSTLCPELSSSPATRWRPASSSVAFSAALLPCPPRRY